MRPVMPVSPYSAIPTDTTAATAHQPPLTDAQVVESLEATGAPAPVEDTALIASVEGEKVTDIFGLPPSEHKSRIARALSGLLSDGSDATLLRYPTRQIPLRLTSFVCGAESGSQVHTISGPNGNEISFTADLESGTLIFMTAAEISTVVVDHELAQLILSVFQSDAELDEIFTYIYDENGIPRTLRQFLASISEGAYTADQPLFSLILPMKDAQGHGVIFLHGNKSQIDLIYDPFEMRFYTHADFSRLLDEGAVFTLPDGKSTVRFFSDDYSGNGFSFSGPLFADEAPQVEVTISAVALSSQEPETER